KDISELDSGVRVRDLDGPYGEESLLQSFIEKVIERLDVGTEELLQSLEVGLRRGSHGGHLRSSPLFCAKIGSLYQRRLPATTEAGSSKAELDEEEMERGAGEEGYVDLAATSSCPRTVGPSTWSTRRGQPIECKYGGRQWLYSRPDTGKVNTPYLQTHASQQAPGAWWKGIATAFFDRVIEVCVWH
ncbi:hypothetical protein BHM03_00022139, partial [Ensete ventricosum]